jgi:hypothetical protein
MNVSQNTGPDEKKPLSDAAGSHDSKEQPAEKIVIPDECGDSLWDDVLAQYPDLTTVIKKQADTDDAKGASGQ